MCNVQTLVTNGILRTAEGEEVAEETLTFEFAPIVLFHISGLINIYKKCRDRKEYRVFQKLLRMVPRLIERLSEASNEETMMIAHLVCPTIAPLVLILSLIHRRFKRAYRARDPTIQRA